MTSRFVESINRVREMIDLLFPAASMRAPYMPYSRHPNVTHGVNE
jgi:hypothetical protein